MSKKAVFLITLIVFVSWVTNSCSNQKPGNEDLLNPKSKEWLKQAPEQFNVKFTTTKGEFVLKIHKSWAPLGSNRFYNLVRLGFFDNSRFYRVREGYIVQFGIPGDPSTAQVWEKDEIEDDPVIESNLKSYIAFAMTGPNTRTTELFIN